MAEPRTPRLLRNPQPNYGDKARHRRRWITPSALQEREDPPTAAPTGRCTWGQCRQGAVAWRDHPDLGWLEVCDDCGGRAAAS